MVVEDLPDAVRVGERGMRLGHTVDPRIAEIGIGDHAVWEAAAARIDCSQPVSSTASS